MAYRRAPGNHDVNRGRQFIKYRLGSNATILYDRYLVNRTGSANKFYYTAIAEADGKFYAMGAYGRIGSLGDVFNIKGGKSSPMATCADIGEALRLVQGKENQKMKGKKDRNTGEMSRYSDYELGAEEWTQEFAKLMGAYPLPPNNQYAVGGFMDEGFEYAVNQAEEYQLRGSLYGCDRCEEEVSDGNAYYPKATGSDDDTRICEDCYREEPTFSIYQAEDWEPTHNKTIEVKGPFGKETWTWYEDGMSPQDPKAYQNKDGERCASCGGDISLDYARSSRGYRYCEGCWDYATFPNRAGMGENRFHHAEMREITDGMVAVLDDDGKTKGVVELSEEDDEVIMDISDSMMEPITEVVLESEDDLYELPATELIDLFYQTRNALLPSKPAYDEYEYELLMEQDPSEIVEEILRMKKTGKPSTITDYLEAESTTPSFLKIVGATAAVFGIFGLLNRKLEKNAETLIENPNTGDLKPADYEEIVVESTGYYVPIIPVSLDGSFMGSRFHALPTDRIVYDDPNGIGAHIDVAMTRDTNFLPNEQSLVMNTEAPGQSPYNSMTGQENPDFAYRVIHETNPVSLDGSVAKFIPTDLSGYTGQQFVPTSVYEDMLGIGVSGQTPAFRTPKGDGLGGNRFGSRIANPDMLTNVGGPLTDSVNGDYTDGSSTMTLSQWSIENQVQQISDTEAVVISRGSGERKMIRRV